MVKGDRWNIWGLFDHWWLYMRQKWEKKKKKKMVQVWRHFTVYMCLIEERNDSRVTICCWKYGIDKKTNFLPCQQKSTDRKSSSRGYRGPTLFNQSNLWRHSHAASHKNVLLWGVFVWILVVFHCDPWTKCYCCILVSAWQWLDFH